MVAHPFNPRNRRVDLRVDLWEFKVSLIYKGEFQDRQPVLSPRETLFWGRKKKKKKQKRSFTLLSLMPPKFSDVVNGFCQ